MLCGGKLTHRDYILFKMFICCREGFEKEMEVLDPRFPVVVVPYILPTWLFSSWDFVWSMSRWCDLSWLCDEIG